LKIRIDRDERKEEGMDGILPVEIYKVGNNTKCVFKSKKEVM